MNEHLLIVAGIVVICGFGTWWFLRCRVDLASANLIAPKLMQPQECPNSLIIGDIDLPLITVSPIDIPVVSDTKMPDSSHLAANLEPLLNRAPELLRVGREMTTKTLRVVFSPEVTRGLQNGTLSLTQDAAKTLMPVARDVSSGRFVQIGRTVATNGVRLANIAAASWQIAAIATAQHYLAEINERLQCIEDRLKDIQFFQKEEKRAEIRGAVQLLKQYHDAISRAALHPNEVAAIYQKIEDIEEKCLGVGELARRLAEEEFKKLDNIEVKEIMDPLGTERRAGEWLTSSKETVELVFLAESCRMVACHVKAALPGDRMLISKRIEDIRIRVHESANHVRALQERFHKKIVRPLDPSSDFFRRTFGYHDHGSDAAKTFARVRDEVSKMAASLDDQANRAREMAQHFDQLAESGLSLDVRLDDNGKVDILSVQSA